jgi:hypothetical protein
LANTRPWKRKTHETQVPVWSHLVTLPDPEGFPDAPTGFGPCSLLTRSLSPFPGEHSWHQCLFITHISFIAMNYHKRDHLSQHNFTVLSFWRSKKYSNLTPPLVAVKVYVELGSFLEAPGKDLLTYLLPSS